MNKSKKLMSKVNMLTEKLEPDLGDLNEEMDPATQIRIVNLTIDALSKFRTSDNLGTRLNYLAELIALNTAANLTRSASVTTLIGQAIATGRPYTGKL